METKQEIKIILSHCRRLAVKYTGHSVVSIKKVLNRSELEKKEFVADIA